MAQTKKASPKKETTTNKKAGAAAAQPHEAARRYSSWLAVSCFAAIPLLGACAEIVGVCDFDDCGCEGDKDTPVTVNGCGTASALEDTSRCGAALATIIYSGPGSGFNPGCFTLKQGQTVTFKLATSALSCRLRGGTGPKSVDTLNPIETQSGGGTDLTDTTATTFTFTVPAVNCMIPFFCEGDPDGGAIYVVTSACP